VVHASLRIGIGLSAIVVANSVSAQSIDLISHRPVAEWSGFYGGAIIAVAEVEAQLPRTGETVRPGGYSAGLVGGYRWTAGQLTMSFEADLSLNLLRGRSTPSGLTSFAYDSLYDARARVVLGRSFGPVRPVFLAGVGLHEDFVHGAQPALVSGENRMSPSVQFGFGVEVDVPAYGITLRPEIMREFVAQRAHRIEPYGSLPVQAQSTYVRVVALYHGTRTAETTTSPSEQPQSWSGAHIGIIAGYDTLRLRSTSNAPVRTDASGPSFGLGIGYDWQWSSLVLGLHGNVAIKSDEGTSSSINFREYIEADWAARFGYSVGSYLPYIAAGASWTRSEQSDPVTLSQRGRIPVRSLEVAVGLDHLVDPRTFLRLEMRYLHNLESAYTPFNYIYSRQTRTSRGLRLGLFRAI
jgi:outer membrane immunogenic protein